jgi:hypothetical protein
MMVAPTPKATTGTAKYQDAVEWVAAKMTMATGFTG